MDKSLKLIFIGLLSALPLSESFAADNADTALAIEDYTTWIDGEETPQLIPDETVYRLMAEYLLDIAGTSGLQPTLFLNSVIGIEDEIDSPELLGQLTQYKALNEELGKETMLDACTAARVRNAAFFNFDDFSSTVESRESENRFLTNGFFESNISETLGTKNYEMLMSWADENLRRNSKHSTIDVLSLARDKGMMPELVERFAEICSTLQKEWQR
ncbi:MAG: hypothetical protein RQ899_00770 [Pseudomonadales bacterium]|nr:hypothetical protein [Pseudomonadales bacterium]